MVSGVAGMLMRLARTIAFLAALKVIFSRTSDGLPNSSAV
jgi:hypothetical protein